MAQRQEKSQNEDGETSSPLQKQGGSPEVSVYTQLVAPETPLLSSKGAVEGCGLSVGIGEDQLLRAGSKRWGD